MEWAETIELLDRTSPQNAVTTVANGLIVASAALHRTALRSSHQEKGSKREGDEDRRRREMGRSGRRDAEVSRLKVLCLQIIHHNTIRRPPRPNHAAPLSALRLLVLRRPLISPFLFPPGCCSRRSSLFQLDYLLWFRNYACTQGFV